MAASQDPLKRSKANTRARLLEAAFTVFAERGFQAATVEQICEAAGFTRGAFYSNFSSKDELFFALWSDRATRILADLERLAGRLTDAPHRVEEIVDDMVRGVTGDRQWFLISTEFLLYAVRHREAATTLADQRRALRVGLGRVVERVLTARGSEPLGDRDLDREARHLVAAIEGCQHQIWVEPDALADGDLQVTMVRRLLQ